MRPIGTTPLGTRHLGIGTIALGLALASGVAVAQAQTAVTRQITSEPVETVVTQGPNGTAVTRRILSPPSVATEPGVSLYTPPPVAYGPVATETVEPQYVEPAAPAVATRRVTTSRTTTAPARTRIATHRARTETRTVTRTVVTPPSEPALVLSPAQRQVIYRTVVQREVYPAPVPLAPPAEAYAPPPPAGYPVRTVYPADEAYGADDGYDAYAYDPYHDQVVRDPYRPAYRQDVVPLMVGARIPQSVPLIAVPQPVAARIPAAAPYSYAVIDNRVYLVDPATSLIVAAIAP